MNKIYFDLDGVMANFEKAVVQTVGIHYWDRTQDKFWKELGAVPHFYYNLEVLHGAIHMFYRVYSEYGPEVVEVLTGCPEPTDLLVTSSDDKVNWFHDNIHPDVTVNTIIGGKNKYFYLEDNPGSLLIDDYDRNIKSWIAHGGVGILHTDPASTIEKLKLLNVLER